MTRRLEQNTLGPALACVPGCGKPAKSDDGGLHFLNYLSVAITLNSFLPPKHKDSCLYCSEGCFFQAFTFLSVAVCLISSDLRLSRTSSSRITHTICPRQQPPSWRHQALLHQMQIQEHKSRPEAIVEEEEAVADQPQRSTMYRMAQQAEDRLAAN